MIITCVWISDSLSGATVKERIVTAPHPVLRQKATPIDRKDHETIQLLIEMANYLDDSIRPIAGISLPQVAVSQRGFVVMIDDEPIIMINPLITKVGQEMPSLEGCLSLPGRYGYVNRNSSVIIEYHDEDWERQTLRLETFYAFVVQHEYDHLEGILFTDKLLAEAPERLRGSDIPLE
ncbi:MAG TPA: peptide deformylase [Sporomusa sp.]|nr:peptide deformylase [Sporomusa sp.]